MELRLKLPTSSLAPELWKYSGMSSWRDFFDDSSSADVVSSHTCASTLCAALPPKPLVGFYFWEVDDGVDKAKYGEEVLSEDGVFLMSGEKTSRGKNKMKGSWSPSSADVLPAAAAVMHACEMQVG